MCRLAAFPPGFPKEEAMNLMVAQTGSGNQDGTGSCFIHNGEPVIRKWPIHIGKVVEQGLPLLASMPSDSWTICHTRAQTHGSIADRNTHPFTHGDWTVCHNGVWYEHARVRKLLKKRFKLQGETDSEVAAALIADLGPEDFYDYLELQAGVFLALNKSGHLWVVKKGGALNFANVSGKTLLASDLRSPYDWKHVWDGWYHFGPDGLKIADSEPVNPYPLRTSASISAAEFEGFDTDNIPGYLGSGGGHPRESGQFIGRDYRKEKHREARAEEESEDDKAFRLKLDRDGFVTMADGSIVSKGTRPCRQHGITPVELCPECKPDSKVREYCTHRVEKKYCMTCAGSLIPKVIVLCEHKKERDLCLACAEARAVDKPKFALVPTVDQLQEWLDFGGV